jgi:hypothetical protein
LAEAQQQQQFRVLIMTHVASKEKTRKHWLFAPYYLLTHLNQTQKEACAAAAAARAAGEQGVLGNSTAQGRADAHIILLQLQALPEIDHLVFVPASIRVSSWEYYAQCALNKNTTCSVVLQLQFHVSISWRVSLHLYPSLEASDLVIARWIKVYSLPSSLRRLKTCLPELRNMLSPSCGFQPRISTVPKLQRNVAARAFHMRRRDVLEAGAAALLLPGGWAQQQQHHCCCCGTGLCVLVPCGVYWAAVFLFQRILCF